MEQCQTLHLSDVGLACQANIKRHNDTILDHDHGFEFPLLFQKLLVMPSIPKIFPGMKFSRILMTVGTLSIVVVP